MIKTQWGRKRGYIVRLEFSFGGIPSEKLLVSGGVFYVRWLAQSARDVQARTVGNAGNRTEGGTSETPITNCRQNFDGGRKHNDSATE